MKRVNTFRYLCEKRLVKYWRRTDDLASKVVTSLVELMRDRPQKGWVPADSVTSQVALNEIARLSKEKREFQAKVDELLVRINEMKTPTDLQQKYDRLMRMKTLDYVNIITYAEDLKMSDVSFLNTLLSISRKLAVGCSEQALDKSVAKAMAINTEDGDIFDCHELLAELAANGILETFYVERHFLGKIDNVRHFKLSEHGREFLTFAEKINS